MLAQGTKIPAVDRVNTLRLQTPTRECVQVSTPSPCTMRVKTYRRAGILREKGVAHVITDLV